MSYRQQLRRDLETHRRDQALALLNRKVTEAMEARLGIDSGSLSVAPEASTPVDPASSGVS